VVLPLRHASPSHGHPAEAADILPSRSRLLESVTPVADIPADPGTYVLGLELTRRIDTVIGALGRFAFEPGLYLYVGSARGPGGLAARLNHHLHSRARPHWHLDHLRETASPIAVWFLEGSERRECIWATRLARSVCLSSGPAGFGASDCRCETHLFRTTDPWERVWPLLDQTLHPATRRSPIPRAVVRNCVT
jgi:Uri superfamily endonuclease